LVTAGADQTARLWDLRAADPAANPRVLRGHEGTIWAVGISPDNHWLVTAGADRTARLWDLTASDPAAKSRVLRGHEGEVSAVAISPDNHWLVTASDDRTARLWDLTASDPAASPVVLRGHEGEVCAVAISADNHWLVTAGADQTARLWPLQANDLIELARVAVGRNFSINEWQLYFPGQPYHQTFAEYQGQTTKYADIPNTATEFQRHTAQDNAKAFFSHLTRAKKLELMKRNIQSVLIPTTQSSRTSPKAKAVMMRFSVEGQTLIDGDIYEFETHPSVGTVATYTGHDPEYVGK
jgi:hypothetical protein